MVAEVIALLLLLLTVIYAIQSLLGRLVIESNEICESSVVGTNNIVYFVTK